VSGVLFSVVQVGNFWTALFWGAVPALLALGAIWWVDRYEKEPLRLLGLAFVFGAVVAPLIAYAIERGLAISTSFTGQGLVPHYQLGPGLPLVEELVRGAAVLVVLLLVRSELDDVLDGIVYGGVVGVGFGAAANFVSIWSTQPFGTDTPSLYSTAITQLNHVFYGALIGCAIGFVRKRSTAVMGAAALVGSAAAFGLHLLHDYLPWWVATSSTSVSSSFWSRVLTQAPNYLGVFALVLIAVWALGREKMIVADGLRDEVGGAVTEADFANVTNSFRRAYTLWAALFARGERVWRSRRTLYGLEVELAFRKYHRREDTSDASRHFLDEDDYRNRIGETRRQLSELDPAYSAESAPGARPPSHPLIGGLGGLAVAIALIAAGVLIWAYALRPTPQNTSTQAAAAPATRTLAAAQAGGTAQVWVCQTHVLAKCNTPYRRNYGWEAPASWAQAGIFVIISWKNEGNSLGTKITVGLMDPATRQGLVTPLVCSVRYANGYCWYRFRGRVSPGAKTLVVAEWGSTFLKFNTPLIHWT